MQLKFKNEKLFSEFIISKLKIHNQVYPQQITDKKDGFIDYILIPKNQNLFKHRDILFGLESKVFNYFHDSFNNSGTKKQLDIFTQCLRYSNRTFWRKEIFVFAPNIYTNFPFIDGVYNPDFYTRNDEKMHLHIRSLFAFFGIGTWQFIGEDLYLFYKSNLIYSTKSGYTKLAYIKNNYLQDKQTFNHALNITKNEVHKTQRINRSRN